AGGRASLLSVFLAWIASGRSRRRWDSLAAEHARWASSPRSPVPLVVSTGVGTPPRSRRWAPVVAALILTVFALSLAFTFPRAPRYTAVAEPALLEAVSWATPRRTDTLSPRVALSY